MVFVLEDIAKIEADRYILPNLTETHIYTQTGTDILTDPNITKVIRSVLEPYVEFRE